MKRLLLVMMVFAMLPMTGAYAAGDTSSFDLTSYISTISTDVENPDSDPAMMIDGHLDSPWLSKKGSLLPQTVTLDFGGRQAMVTRVAVSCQSAADEGVKNIDIDFLDESGAWKPLRRNITLEPATEQGSGMMEALNTESRPAMAGALRIRINDARIRNGAFNISEISVWGSKVFYPAGNAEAVKLNGARGEQLILPDTVKWQTEQGSIEAPVLWEEKNVFCDSPGRREITGTLGRTETVKAEVTVSEESGFPSLTGHWSQKQLEHLRLWRVYAEEDSAIQPDDAADKGKIAEWFYKGLGISHEYLPERIALTKEKLFSDTEATEPNELAALGLLPKSGDFQPDGTMTRMELARLCYEALRFELDTEPEGEALLFTDEISEPDRAPLEALAKAKIISNAGEFRGGGAATNAEALTMLDRLIGAVTASKVYPAPADDAVSTMPDYTVKVNGQEAGTYLAHSFPGAGAPQEKTINGRPAAEAAVSYFDFAGSAEVEITLNNQELGDASNAVVRPLSLGIRPEINGNKLRFTLYQPCNISVEPWGTRKPLQLFANPMEKNKPDLEAENVYYYGPGVHYIDPVVLKDGDVVYVDGGAVVYTKVQPDYTDGGVYYGYSIQSIEPTFSARRDNTGPDDKLKNITVRGRGIISGSSSFLKLQRHQLLRIYGCENFRVDGVILLEGSAWNVFVAQSDGVYINNIKMVGYFANNDGIDFCDSINGVVENCFANNADDSFLIKSWYAVDNVHFRNCSVWNTVSTSFGAVCEVIQPITNVSYTDCTVLHSTYPAWTEICGGIIGIWDNGAADIDNMLFENIVIEDAVAGKEPIKIGVYTAMAEGPKEFAEVKNVVFKDITVLDSRDERIVLTTPFTDGIHDITFENVSINGKKVMDQDERFILQNAADIHVKP